MRDMNRYPPVTGDLKAFLDTALAEGVPVVYVSAGTVVFQSTDETQRRLDAFVSMGRSDRVRFVWSYKEGFEGLAVDRDLIYPSTFVPQQAVLNHPAVKVFMTHGGANSMMEMIYAAKAEDPGSSVVALCVPKISDQFNDCQFMLDHGFGLTLSPEADSDAVIATLRSLLANHADRADAVVVAKRRSEAAGMGPDAYGARRAVHLVEVTAKNGVRHLFPEICYWPLYALFGLDMLATGLFAAVVVLCTCRCLCRCCCRGGAGGSGSAGATSKQKTS